MKLSVTVVLVSLNDQKIMGDCLKSIRRQKYDGSVSILVIDGGSTDNTVSIAKKYKAHVTSLPKWRDYPNKRTDYGMNLATSDIVVFFSADNRFLENNCLHEMIQPFNDKHIAAVETFHYGFSPQSSILTKYFALIGGADPIAVLLGKADRAPLDTDTWHSFGKVKEYDRYFKVQFNTDPNSISTLGANGIAIRNSLLKKYPMKGALHTEMCLRFMRNGYNTFAFVKKVHIVHEIQQDLLSFCKRRLQWSNLYSNTTIKRSYNVFNLKRDGLKLVWIIVTAITGVVPLVRAMKGYAGYKSWIWFLHPLILPIFVLAYGIQIFKKFFITAHV